MKTTVSFANPFTMTAWTGAILAVGWAIGARWGHTITAAWMLFLAAILLYLHDVVIALMLAMAVTKASSSNRP